MNRIKNILHLFLLLLKKIINILFGIPFRLFTSMKMLHAYRSIFLFIFRWLFLLAPLIGLFFVHISIPCKYRNDAFEIISSLIPMVFTVIAISISWKNTNVCGVDSHQYRKMRRGARFGLTEMLLLACLLFTEGVVFKIVDFTICLWLTYAISVFYCFWFSIQEMPILTNNYRRINRITRRIVLAECSFNSSALNTSDNEIVNKIICFYLVNDGIRSTYNILKIRTLFQSLKFVNKYDYSTKSENGKYRKKIRKEIIEEANIVLLRYLINLVISLNKDLSINWDIYKHSGNYPFGLKVSDFIILNFKNLRVLLESNDDFLNHDKMLSYLLRSFYFSVWHVCKANSLEKLFNQESDSLIHHSILSYSSIPHYSKETLTRINSWISLSLIATVSSGDFWFADYLKDGITDNGFVFDERIPYFLFLSIYLYSVYQVNKDDSELQQSVQAFMERINPLMSYSNDDWYRIFKKLYHDGRGENIIEAIPQLLNIIDSIDKHVRWFKKPAQNSWISNAFDFDKEFAINCCCELIFSSSYYMNDKEVSEYKKSVEKSYYSLSKENKEIFVRCLDNYWFQNTLIKPSEEFGILKFYRLSNRSIKDVCVDKKISDIFLNLKNNEKKPFVLETPNFDEAGIKEEIEKCFTNIKSQAMFDGVIDEKIVVKEQSLIYKIEHFSKNAFLSMLPKLFERAFLKLLSTEIEEYFANNKMGKPLLILCANDIKNLVSAGMVNTNINLFDYDWNPSDFSTILNNIQRSSLSLTSTCFWKNDAFKIHIKEIDNCDFVKQLSDEEVEELIEKRYSVGIGQYAYSDAVGSKDLTFLSYKDIYNKIKQSYRKIEIPFKYNVSIDKTKIQIVKTKIE